jgi:hypothetical protein
MTRDDEILLDTFDEKLRLLIGRHDALKAENLELRTRLTTAVADLTKAREDYAVLEQSYLNLKTSRVLEGIEIDDVGSTRDRLARLVREVDHCIALLNA